MFIGEHTDASSADVAKGLETCFDHPPEVFSIHRHGDGSMLIYFAAREDRNRVLSDTYVKTPYFQLLVKLWSRRAKDTAGGLGVHMSLEIKGVLANAWSVATGETILAPNSWVEWLDPLTRPRANMDVFRLTAWCLDPSLIPKEVDFHLLEPYATSSKERMVAPASTVTLPQVSMLIHPLLRREWPLVWVPYLQARLL